MKRFKSNPVFNKNVVIEQSGGHALIKDVVIIQEGLDKIDDYITPTFLEGIAKQGNSYPQGVKCRFGHPNMCKESLGSYIGRYKNFSVKYDESDKKKKVIADLELDPIAKSSPQGDLHKYIIDMANTNADMLGNSIVFSAMDNIKEMEVGGEVKTVNELILETFIASDLVDSPCATDSLFKGVDDVGVKITHYLDENPEILDLVTDNPKLLSDFLDRYIAYKSKKQKLDPMTIKNLKEKVKGMAASLGLSTEKKKDISLATEDGKTVVVETEAEEPAVGDPVTVDGEATPNASYTLADGRVLKTDADSKISEITPAAEAPAEETPEMMKEKITALEKKNAELIAAAAENEADNQEVAKHVDAMSAEITRLKAENADQKKKIEAFQAKQASTYTPPKEKNEPRRIATETDKHSEVQAAIDARRAARKARVSHAKV